MLQIFQHKLAICDQNNNQKYDHIHCRAFGEDWSWQKSRNEFMWRPVQSQYLIKIKSKENSYRKKMPRIKISLQQFLNHLYRSSDMQSYNCSTKVLHYRTTSADSALIHQLPRVLELLDVGLSEFWIRTMISLSWP